MISMDRLQTNFLSQTAFLYISTASSFSLSYSQTHNLKSGTLATDLVFREMSPTG